MTEKYFEKRVTRSIASINKKNQVPFKQQDSSSRQTGLGIEFRFDSHPHRIGMLLCPEGISPLSI